MRIFLFVFICCLSAGNRVVTATQRLQDTSRPPANLEWPTLKAGQSIVHHTGFALVYNEPHEQADWVAYELTAEETLKSFERGDVFMRDPLVSTGTADETDYLHSGYDRGHLAPAADLGFSLSSMAESFYYSNMSPQLPAFNRGVWKRLETQARGWAKQYGAVELVTGPVLTPGLPSIGPNKVSVPRLYYKVVLDYRLPEHKAIGFVLPNAGSSLPINHYAVTVDSVERLTGLDFFSKLPDVQEQKLEAGLCLPCWTWSSTGSGGQTDKGATQKKTGNTSVQCGASTKSGGRCKRMTSSPNGNCWQHGGD